MFQLTDQLGNTICFKERPKRIISLVPSQSELLWDLGLKQELVGITKFCIHPKEMFQTVARVGGTKNLDIDKIRQLKPDLIIGNKEENEQSQIELLQQEFKVFMSDIYNFDDVYHMIKTMGDVFDKNKTAENLIVRLQESLKRVKNFFAGQSVLYFIWNQPYMCAANQTFIHYVLNFLGFDNVIASLERYPEMDKTTLKKLNPAFCFLSSEPFPFKEKHKKELQEIFPDSTILIVDGEMFSWYGSRLLYLEDYLHTLPIKRLML